MSGDTVTRMHRLVGVAAGVFFGANLAMLGMFVELLVVTVVAGLFVGVGTALLVPALIHATHTGGFPAAPGGSDLNAGALGMALDVGGLTMVFSGFVFESAPVPIGIGLVVAVVCLVVLDWGLPQRSAAPASG